MRWIKLYGNALNDKRLLNLRNDHGFLGIGVYYALLSHVECLGEGMQHIDQLTGLFNGKVTLYDAIPKVFSRDQLREQIVKLDLTTDAAVFICKWKKARLIHAVAGQKNMFEKNF